VGRSAPGLAHDLWISQIREREGKLLKIFRCHRLVVAGSPLADQSSEVVTSRHAEAASPDVDRREYVVRNIANQNLAHSNLLIPTSLPGIVLAGAG
jgi:hypothetical protein